MTPATERSGPDIIRVQPSATTARSMRNFFIPSPGPFLLPLPPVRRRADTPVVASC
ncbi:hypothetical protein CAter10_2526 [Collimonas arenae]|nr:hypothetical protein CAter10_2526 [Collimonas arenae]